MREQDKYRQMWEHPAYREVSPGELGADLFLKLAHPKPDDTITDYGCGTGRAGLKLSAYARVRMLDFTDNSLDSVVRDNLGDTLTFEQWDLTTPIAGFSKFGVCTDVMEHIPTSDVPVVLKNIVHSCRHGYFQISCVPDRLGALIGEPLHLTVRPYSWWLERFNELGCTIHFSHDNETDCIFYVSAWADGKSIKDIATVNVSESEIREHVLRNAQRGLQEVRPHERQEQELIILAGGPSLNDYVDEIRLNKKMGIPVVTLNGSYNWALAHGIKPDVQIVLDARAFNKRFVDPIVPTCKYLIASQCHPELVDSIPKDQIWLWHSGYDVIRSVIDELGVTKDIYPVMGGMTVPLRAIPLLLMLGFHRYIIYGFDSCLRNGEHHAYAQPENDYNGVLDISCGGRTFKCHGWMATQAREFLELQPMIADLCEMDVKGGGLIAHLIETGADRAKLGGMV